MELLLVAVVLLALRGSASSGTATGQQQQQPGGGAAGGSSADVAGKALGAASAAVPLVAAAGSGIAGLFGGGASATTAVTAASGAVVGGAAVVTGEVLEATASSFIEGAIQGAAQGALLGGGATDAAGSVVTEVSAEAVAEGTGLTAGGLIGGVGFLAIGAAVIAFFIAFVGPPLAKLCESAVEWGRKRQYGKVGVLANYDAIACDLEQGWAKALLQSQYGTNVLNGNFRADPASANLQGTPATPIWQISTVLGTADFEVQRLVMRVARTFAIQQLYARNKALGSFFSLTKGQTDAANETNGVALSGASFIAWAQAYCSARKYTSWGLNLAPTNDLAEYSWAGMRASISSLFGTQGWSLTLARLDFFGKSAAAAMCAVEGYSFNWPGEDNFTNGINAYCGLNWRKVGLWLIDDSTNGAVNPCLSRQFGGAPQTIDAHLLDPGGSVMGMPYQRPAILAAVNPPVDVWL